MVAQAHLSLRLPKPLVARVRAHVDLLQASTGLAVTTADVFRLALERGRDALEAGAVAPKARAKKPKR